MTNTKQLEEILDEAMPESWARNRDKISPEVRAAVELAHKINAYSKFTNEIES
jgi:hypothetical protein